MLFRSKLPTIEIYGTKGTITVPDPNQFSEHTYLYTEAEPEWKKVEHVAGYENAGRGIGLAEMADSINLGKEFRASGELGFHVLEVMESILKSSSLNQRIPIESTVKNISFKV